ncbi:Dip2/Utp12 family-domain-containing protein [Ampelomyces quisqualis]|uniref:Dip2/Utp12 family-domain-containing protein n=1 Tax=Ampelomyces quisqualis TaxID=50730 RepID=A0A6A5QR48_AMPQU|nr:Dip2/Utp12 family-domain-containing protein [Ampelomyces quisqualis]
MPAAVASRPQKNARATRDGAPPAKKTKLAQPPPAARPNGLTSLINGTSTHKPAATVNGLKNLRSHRVDDATAVVKAGHGDVDMADAEQQVVEISSSSEEDDDDSEPEDTEAGAHAEDAAPAVNGHVPEQDGPSDDETPDAEELSFGNRLRAQDPEPVQESHMVDVESAFVGHDAGSASLTTTSKNRALSAPSMDTLGELLTQALRTNDQDQLETCLQNVSVDAVAGTVQRLPSPLVGILLQRLAERLHKKPGRAGILMVWVQWSLAAHGGYLASQPQLVKQLSTLNKVLKERASGLQPLLALKGRLDMLQLQLNLRRKNQTRAAQDDEEEAVIYVEGEDDYVSSADESIGGDAQIGVQKRLRDDFEDDDESSVDQMPTTMEVDEESDEGSEDSENLLDDEAEETDVDTGDDMSEPTNDDVEEEGEGVSGSEEETKPARRSTAARAGLKSRR